MGLKRYIARRCLEGVLTIFVVMTIIFFLYRLMPGDPVSMIVDPKMTPEIKARIRSIYGLDQPLIVQYFVFLKNLLTLNLGISFTYSTPVSEKILELLPNTILLFTLSSLLTSILGIYLGRIIGWRRNSKTEYVLTISGILIYFMPVFWVGYIFLYVFGYELGWFPIGGMRDYMLWTFGPTLWEKFVDILMHLVLPVATLTIVGFCGMMLLMRTSMVETLKEDYVSAATARGLPDKIVRNRYAARNAELPVITAFMLSVSFSIGGGVLTEVVFNWPGLGYELFQATITRDYPLAQGLLFILAVMAVVTVILIDVVYVFLDPRVSYD